MSSRLQRPKYPVCIGRPVAAAAAHKGANIERVVCQFNATAQRTLQRERRLEVQCVNIVKRDRGHRTGSGVVEVTTARKCDRRSELSARAADQ